MNKQLVHGGGAVVRSEQQWAQIILFPQILGGCRRQNVGKKQKVEESERESGNYELHKEEFLSVVVLSYNNRDHLSEEDYESVREAYIMYLLRFRGRSTQTHIQTYSSSISAVHQSHNSSSILSRQQP